MKRPSENFGWSLEPRFGCEFSQRFNNFFFSIKDKLKNFGSVKKITKALFDYIQQLKIFLKIPNNNFVQHISEN